MNFHYQILIHAIGYLLIGCGLALPLIHINIKYALKFGLIDWPKARGITDEHTPIVGPGLILIALVTLGLVNYFYQLQGWFLVSAFFMAVMGYFDDKKPIPPIDKLVWQILCVALVVIFDPLIHTSITARYGLIGSLWAGFFILGLTNAINFVDGIDGLAGTVILVGGLGTVALTSALPKMYPYTICASVLIGLMIPFLYLNIRHRKGFLGNTGSYFFSYYLAVMHLSIPIQTVGPVSRLAISGLCFLIPIADAGTVVLTRLLSGRSPFQPDRGHLHHRLVQTGLALRWILLNFGLVEGVALLSAILLAFNTAIRYSALPGYLCFGFVLLTGVFVLLIEKTSRKRIQTFFQRIDAQEPLYIFKYKLVGQGPIAHKTLRRIEAKMSAEIRVHDACVVEPPGNIFLSLHTRGEPLKFIAGRLEPILRNEKLNFTLTVEKAEFVKQSEVFNFPTSNVA